MPDVDDIALLREFVNNHSESAFAAIVQRRVNLVYSVALRLTGNSEDAQDVTQAVFVILARKAAGLRPKTILTGWLYETTRFAAMNFLTRNNRRQRREQEAYMQSTLNDAEASWPQLALLLESAMSRLSEKDRTLVALRFYENRSMAETAAVLGVNESAARKRAERAIEKLRAYFSKRGVHSTAETIAGAIAANSLQTAPATLAKTTTAVALAKGATASTSTFTLIKGALKIMAWTKAKTAIVIGVGMLFVAGTATVTVREIVTHRGEVWQRKYDPNGLDRLPREVKILPSLPSTVQSHEKVAGQHNNRAAVGLGQSVPSLLMIAYGISPAQLITNAPMPGGKYDFIANLPTWEANLNAMQEDIQKKFGLTARRETIETNVLILTVQSRNAPDLHRATRRSQISRDEKPGSYSAHDSSIVGLVSYLERNLGIMVIDRTGLKGNLDIDLKWDQTPEGLKQALLDELGLKLTPGAQPVQFVVVEKAK